MKKRASIQSIFLGLIFLTLSSSSLLENGYSCTEKKIKRTPGQTTLIDTRCDFLIKQLIKHTTKKISVEEMEMAILRPNIVVGHPISRHLQHILNESPEVSEHITRLLDQAKKLGRSEINLGDALTGDHYEDTKKVIDAISRAAYNDQFLRSLRNSRSSLIRDNVEVIHQQLLIEIVLRRDGVLPSTALSMSQRVNLKFKQVSALLLPWKHKKIQLKLSQTAWRIYQRYGSDGLYQYLYHTHGSGVALKYWMFHLNTIQVVSVITIIAIAMPDLYQSLKIWDQDNFHDLSEEQKNEAKRIVVELNRDPDELLLENYNALTKKLEKEDLSENEREDIEEMLDLIRGIKIDRAVHD